MDRDKEITEEIIAHQDAIWDLQKERMQLRKKGKGMPAIIRGGHAKDGGWFGKSK